MIVHILDQGKVLCGFNQGLPGKWPVGNTWVGPKHLSDAPVELRCKACVAAMDGMNESSITCPKCGVTSYNPNDIEQRHCGYCHQFPEFLIVSIQMREFEQILLPPPTNTADELRVKLQTEVASKLRVCIDRVKVIVRLFD
jgi:predicted nucleic-acid-binding Zn-ribbon protein